MISNPGQAQSSTTMLTTTYDTTNKKQDIFAYTDSKVADKVTSTQVASQISSATASFVTSSQVDSKITTKLNDPYRWQILDVIPFSKTLWDGYTNYTLERSRVSGSTTYTYRYFLVELPVPVYATKYGYEFIVELWGWYGTPSLSLFYGDSSWTYSSIQRADLNVHENNSADADVFPHYQRGHKIWSKDGYAKYGEGYSFYVNGAYVTGYTYRPSSSTSTYTDTMQALDFTHVGFSLGNKRSTSTSDFSHCYTYGITLQYRAIQSR